MKALDPKNPEGRTGGTGEIKGRGQNNGIRIQDWAKKVWGRAGKADPVRGRRSAVNPRVILSGGGTGERRKTKKSEGLRGTGEGQVVERWCTLGGEKKG